MRRSFIEGYELVSGFSEDQTIEKKIFEGFGRASMGLSNNHS
jgi:hypothetical protein